MREHRTISIADQIFEQLERDILTGKYQRGEGQNARLAAKLTGWKIDIKSQSQADADAEMNLADENMHAYIPDVDTEEQQ